MIYVAVWVWRTCSKSNNWTLYAEITKYVITSLSLLSKLLNFFYLDFKILSASIWELTGLKTINLC